VKADPEIGSPEELKGLLLEKVVNRVSEIAAPARKRSLAFQYHPSELSSIDYVLSKGAVSAGSQLAKRRDLSLETPALPGLAGIEIRYSQMDNEAEQREYVEVRNQAFVEGRSEAVPPAAIALADWRQTLKDTILPNGTVIVASDSGKLVGSIFLCWNEEQNRKTGRKVGTIENVFVRDAWRRRGIASRMICKGFEYFKEHGLEFARLDMNSVNEPALKLYDSLSFVTVYEFAQVFVLELS
jgi:ribosomal protein S18 acetylase RimI-like enzyme